MTCRVPQAESRLRVNAAFTLSLAPSCPRAIACRMMHIGSLQILRALAALAVAYGHAAHDAELLAARQGMMLAFPLKDLSGLGVDLFFAISGFVMVLSAAPLFGTAGASRRFFLRRLLRIVPIYWLVTFIFLAVVFFKPRVLSSTGIGLWDIVRSLLFIPYQRADSDLIQPVYGLGWTLNYEMFFYLLFALAVMLPIRQAIAAVIGALLAFVAAGWLMQPVAAHWRFWTDPILLEFAFGVVAGALYLSPFKPGRGAGLALLVLGVVLFVALNITGEKPGGWARLWMAGLPLAMAMAGTVFAFPQGSTGLSLLETLGDASYALYLFHPIVIRTQSLAGGAANVPAGWGYVLVALVASAVLAVAIYRMFERPVTRFLQQRIG